MSPSRFAASLLLLTTGCNWASDCISIGRPSHLVTVLDSISGRLIASGATVVITGATFSDTIRLQQNAANLAVALERDGPVTLQIDQVGYRRWTQTGFAAKRGGRCDDIRAVSVTAHLQPGE